MCMNGKMANIKVSAFMVRVALDLQGSGKQENKNIFLVPPRNFQGFQLFSRQTLQNLRKYRVLPTFKNLSEET